MIQFFPSLMSCNQLAIGQAISQLDPHVDGFHLDMMDGHFAPNLALGTYTVNAIAQATSKPLHVHLMVNHPELFLPLLQLRPQDVVLVHVEVLQRHQYAPDYLQVALAPHTKAALGIAVNPETPVASIPEALLAQVAKVLVMAVRPGFSGQTFMPVALTQAETLVTRAKTENHRYAIGIDGGLGMQTIKQAVQAGATQIALASALFGTPDPLAALQILKKLIA